MTSVDPDLLTEAEEDDEYNSYSKRSSASKFVELLRKYAHLPRNRSAVQESFILCCNPGAQCNTEVSLLVRCEPIGT